MRAAGCELLLSSAIFTTGFEKLLVRFLPRLFRGYAQGYVLREFAAALVAFPLNHSHPAGRDVAGVEAEDAAVAHLNVRAKPIGAEHSSRAIKSHRGGDRTFEVLFGTGEDPLPHLLSPSKTADQWVVQTAALKRNRVR